MAGWVRRVSPFGPIVGKELRVTARRRRNYVLRFAYLGVLLLILLMVHLEEAPRGAWLGGVAARAQRSAELGQIFFTAFSYFTLVAMAAVGPILTATAINGERLHKTMHVLLMTPISAWQIVSGKLFSRLLIALTLVALSLPVLAVVRLLGGVEVEQMIASVALCASVALFTAAVGLVLSCVISRAFAVILLAYAFLAFLWMFVPMGVILACEAADVQGQAAFMSLLRVASLGHAFVAMAFIATPAQGVLPVTEWYWCVAVHLGAAAAMVVAAGMLLRRMARREAEGGGGRHGATERRSEGEGGRHEGTEARRHGGEGRGARDRGTGAQAEEAPDVHSGLRGEATPVAVPSAGEDTGGAGSSSPVGDNPVAWRELRRPLIAKRWQAIVGGGVVLLGLIAIYIAMASEHNYQHGSELKDPEYQIAFALIFCGMLNLLACVMAGAAIAHEKESDTWTLLLATPLTARQIVLGKFVGLLKRLLWPAVVIAGHFLFFGLAGVLTWGTVAVVLWLMFTTNVIWLATGLFLSLRVKTVTFAVILNLLLPLIAYAGVAMLLTIAGLLVDSHRADEWAEASMTYAPFAYMVSAIDDWSNDHSARIWMPCAANVRSEAFAVRVALVGLGHLGATAGVLGLMVRHFDRIVGRAAQSEHIAAPLEGAPA